MAGLYEVSVLLQHKLDLSVAECTELDVVHYPGGKRALGEPGEVLDDVVCLEPDTDRGVEAVGGELVFVNVLGPADWLTDGDQEIVCVTVYRAKCLQR